MSHKKIVITGASGFLGSHLVERLKGDHYEVFAFSSKPEELKERLSGENVVYVHKDDLSADILRDSIIISCAYPRNSTGMAVADGLRYIQNVFEAAVESEANAIINISSQSVYSQQRTEAATEETPVCLESPYAVGKYAVELMLESICKGSRTAYTNLRMASLIGPGFDQRIVNRFVKKLLNGESVTVVQQPKKMGFLDVEDAVSAILSVIERPEKPLKSIYNVGSGRGYTVEEIYDAVAVALRNKKNVSSPTIETGKDCSSTSVSYDQLHDDTGFEPKIKLTESIERIISKYDRNQKEEYNVSY